MLKIYQKMASVESIGACSLDFDASGAESFAGKDLTASECTLHSVSVANSVHGASRNGDLDHADFASLERRAARDKLQFPHGCKPTEKCENSVAEIKLPSYVSISCAINGYTSYSRFCRSRDNSPARSSFRKSSLEPTMLADTVRKEAYKSHRYSRSQSDCNGTMQSVYTESKHVTVSKQIQVPLRSSRNYITEVSLTNGNCSESDKIDSIQEAIDSSPVTNGHSFTEHLVLAKELGNDGTKSLVQQRIESLYGKSSGEEIKTHFRSSNKTKDSHLNETEYSIDASMPNGKNHVGSASPPVFRHLNKDFRKQLQLSSMKKSDLQTKISPKLQSKSDKQPLSLISNGIPHDECDRVKSMTPPPLKSQSFDCNVSKETHLDSEEQDRPGYKYLHLIDCEKEKIGAQVVRLEEEMSTHPAIPEDALGKIRAACGKANLLMSQKFEQFRGLCWKNIEENTSMPFYTTASDLAGFWDLVMLQVEDINSTFQEIEAMKNNNWKEVFSNKPVTSAAKIRNSNMNAVSRSNPTTPKRSAKSIELSKAREEARKQLLAAKKRGRQQAAVTEDEVAIFTSSTS